MNTFNNAPEHSELGKKSRYIDQYMPSLLYPVPRQLKRDEIGVSNEVLPFVGADLWTAFELSWLNTKGKPVVAMAHFVFDCASPNLIESKSFKLYLNSFNNSQFESSDEVAKRLRQDLSEAAWRGAEAGKTGSVGVRVLSSLEWSNQCISPLEGSNIDGLDIACTHYQLDASLLQLAQGSKNVTETLTSDLLKSNCLVTGQPDWGSVQIAYSGLAIDHASLLRYLVSFRNHNEFHEQCVERIYVDISRICKPTRLSVYARYTRRGGLDINPFRTSSPAALPINTRLVRQ